MSLNRKLIKKKTHVYKTKPCSIKLPTTPCTQSKLRPCFIKNFIKKKKKKKKKPTPSSYIYIYKPTKKKPHCTCKARAIRLVSIY